MDQRFSVSPKLARFVPSSGVRRYALALLFALAAAVVRIALHPLIGNSSPYITFYVAVVAAAATGGLGPGLLVTGFGAISGILLTRFGGGHFTLPVLAEEIRFGIYLVSTIGISLIARAMHRAHAQAQMQAQQVRSIVESMADAYVLLDRQWRVLDANVQAQRLLKRSLAELTGRNVWDEFPHADEFHVVYSKAMETGQPGHCQGFYAPLGKWFDADVYPTAGSMAVFFRDVTDRKLDELALRRSEQRYRLLSESATDYAIIFLDPSGQITEWSPGAVQMFHMTAAEAIGQSGDIIFTPEDRQADAPGQEMRRALEAGRSIDERWHLRADGRRFYASGVLNVLRDGTRQRVGFVKIIRDITAHMLAQRLAEKERAQLLAVFDAMGDGVVVFDTSGQAVLANEAVARLCGYPNPETFKQDSHRFPEIYELRDLDGRAVPVEQRPVSRVLRGEQIRDLELWTKRLDTGQQWLLNFSGTPVRDAEGRVILAVIVTRDMTEAQRAAAELRQATMLLRALSETTPDPLFVKDRDGRMLWANPAALRAIGKPADQVIGKDETQWHDNPAEAQAIRDNDRRVMDSGQTQVVEEALTDASGNRRIFLGTKSPRVDEQGRVVGLVGLSRDITDRKLMEEQLRAAQLAAEQSRQLAESASRAKDHFLAVLSHELRTPLTPVLVTATLLKATPDLPMQYQADLEVIHRNVELEARLIDDLLDVTRITRGKLELNRSPIPLTEVIARAVEVCRADIEARRLQLTVDLDDTQPVRINADAARLQQVFWNLLKNAIKFTPHGGRIAVRSYRQDADQVVIEVQDNGVGIDPDLLPHIFNPFEQGGAGTTRQFGGLGLGLTITKGLVEMHGGAIVALSPGRGQGTTFRVTLPVCTGETPNGTRDRQNHPSAGARALRILLVEDHGDTARIMRRLLSAAGHQVETAGDVAAALMQLGIRGDRPLRDSPPPFDLIISDLGLPDGTGVDLIRTARSRGITLPAIALSGYGREEDIRRSKEAGFSEHLTKPASPERLNQAIAQLAAAPS